MVEVTPASAWMYRALTTVPHARSTFLDPPASLLQVFGAFARIVSQAQQLVSQAAGGTNPRAV